MSAGARETIKPERGEPYVMRTSAAGDEMDHIARVIRQTDQPDVWTVHDSARNLIWIRFDCWRSCWVRALGQADGEPVPCD